MRPFASCVWLLPVLVLVGCDSKPSSAPQPPVHAAPGASSAPTLTAAGEPADEPVLSMARAMYLVQQVPGAKAHSLGVESPDSLTQTKPGEATVEMIMDATRLTMRFTRTDGHWAWTNSTSTAWSGQPKVPGDVIAWVATRGR